MFPNDVSERERGEAGEPNQGGEHDEELKGHGCVWGRGYEIIL